MPEMHLRQPGFTCIACGPFTKNKERIEKFMQSGNTDFIYKNKLDKAYFQNDMAYDKSKDLVKRTQSDKVLRDKAFKVASDPKYDGYQRGLSSMASIVYFLIKSLNEMVLMNQIINWLINYISHLLKNFKKEKFIHHLEIIFGV